MNKAKKSKKVKRYAGGGLSGIAETAQSLMGDVDGMANMINYGDSSSTEQAAQPGFLSMRKGGYVKTADGCAKKGKTKGKMV